MKSILISIQPQWVEKILNGEKTIEIRKTMPKCELPCKVYIYCTMPNKQENRKPHSWEVVWLKRVVAEFTLNKVSTYDWDTDFLNTNQNMYYIKSGEADKTCLTYEQLCNYGKGKDLYGWHIEDLVIYDTPKGLDRFTHYIPNNECPTKQCGTNCEDCPNYDEEHETCLALYYAHREIKRPPQSWCYVEELED